jgi:hypothetical protein
MHGNILTCLVEHGAAGWQGGYKGHELSRVLTVTTLPAVGDALELALGRKHSYAYQLLRLVVGRVQHGGAQGFLAAELDAQKR